MLYFGKTDIGKKRKGNQDSFGIYRIAENALLLAVCDGMGGAVGGEEASRIALESFSHEVFEVCNSHVKDGLFDSSEVDMRLMLGNAASEANKAVFEKAKEDPELHGMGTTLVALFVVERFAYSVNVGDSRLYRIEDGEISQVTHDHSYVQYLVDLGKLTPEEAKTSSNRNIIIRAVGTDETVESDIEVIDLGEEGKKLWFLLCSDGLTNMVEDNDIAATVSGEGTLAEKTDRLIAEANKNGGADNITAVLVEL